MPFANSSLCSFSTDMSLLCFTWGPQWGVTLCGKYVKRTARLAPTIVRQREHSRVEERGRAKQARQGKLEVPHSCQVRKYSVVAYVSSKHVAATNKKNLS